MLLLYKFTLEWHHSYFFLGIALYFSYTTFNNLHKLFNLIPDYRFCIHDSVVLNYHPVFLSLYYSNNYDVVDNVSASVLLLKEMLNYKHCGKYAWMYWTHYLYHKSSQLYLIQKRIFQCSPYCSISLDYYWFLLFYCLLPLHHLPIVLT